MADSQAHPPVSLTQPAFSSGEISPALYGRVDLARYGTALRTARNFYIRRFGGATNRPGFEFVGEVHDSSSVTRLVDFQFNTDQTYILEFSDFRMRVITDGGVVLDGVNPVVVVTPWSASELSRLQFVQSADVLFVVHPSHPPYSIARTSNVDWTISTYALKNGPFQDTNFDRDVKVYASATTGTVTLTASSAIFKAGHVGSSFFLDLYDYSGYKPWNSDLPVELGDYILASAKIYVATDRYQTENTWASYRTGSTKPDWDEGEGWDGKGYYDSGKQDETSYNIGIKWKYVSAGYGLMTITAVSSDGLTATATVIEEIPADLTDSTKASYKWAFSAFGSQQGYPGAVAFHQQRLVFAGTSAQPQTTWLSKTSAYNDFGFSRPSADDDAVTYTMGSRQVNEIRHIVPLSALLQLTSGAEWEVNTGQDSVLTPSNVALRPQGYRGSSYLPALVVGATALHVQQKGNTVRDLGYDFSSDTYTGNELSVFADHLFQGFDLVSWCYAQSPDSIIWAVRSDGTLLSLTYMREQEVIAWAHHDTINGAFESVACVGEGDEDVVYAVVRRTINGVQKRYVERLHTRQVLDVRDSFFVDSGLTYDGWNTSSTSFGITAPDYSIDKPLTATFSDPMLSAIYVGREIHVPSPDGSGLVMKYTITAVTSTTVATVTGNRDVPANMQGLVTTNWGLAIASFTGMNHLVGETVSILSDGNVSAQVVVDNAGGIALDHPAVVVHAGLPITADLETLDINLATPNDTLINKMISVHQVTVVAESARGLWAGQDANDLWEKKQRSGENYDAPTGISTGKFDIRIGSSPDRSGRILVRQTDPLPVTVLSITPEFTSGST